MAKFERIRCQAGRESHRGEGEGDEQGREVLPVSNTILLFYSPPLFSQDVKEAERIKGMFKNLEKRQQTLYSEYDQALFGPNVVDEVDSSVILEGLHGKYSMPFAKGTHWQSTFGHLNTYGAAYYAYPWAQGIAGNVFNEMSKVGLMNRESGAKLGSLLRPGGSKDPFQLVEGALGYEWGGQKG